MTEESSEVPRELIGKSRAVVDFPSASASPSPPPLRPPHLPRSSHLCPPVRPAKSRRPWGRSGVGQGRWGAPGSLFPSDRLQSRVPRGPAQGGIGRPGSALCCAAGTPPRRLLPPRPGVQVGGGRGLSARVWGVLEARRILYSAQPSVLNSGSPGKPSTGTAGERTVGRLRHVPGPPWPQEITGGRCPCDVQTWGRGALVRYNDWA